MDVKKIKERNIRQALQASIDKIFSFALGEAMSEVVYSYLRNQLELERDAILDEPKRFADGLESLFGSGAKILLNLIAKELASKIDIEYEVDQSFEEYVEKVKSSFKHK